MSEEKQSIVIFDDGSYKSKLLQHELKDTHNIKVVKVNANDNIVEWFTKIQPDDTKIFLHQTYEEFVKDNEQLRKDIRKVEALGFENKIFLAYEGLDEKTAKYRAFEAKIVDDYRIKDQVPEGAGVPEKLTAVGDNDEGKEAVSKEPDTSKFKKKFL